MGRFFLIFMLKRNNKLKIQPKNPFVMENYSGWNALVVIY